MDFEKITPWIFENIGIFEKEDIRIERMINEREKLAIGLINTRSSKAGTFELLEDGDCHMMIADFDSDKLLFHRNTALNDISELRGTLESFLQELENA